MKIKERNEQRIVFTSTIAEKFGGLIFGVIFTCAGIGMSILGFSLLPLIPEMSVEGVYIVYPVVFIFALGFTIIGISQLRKGIIEHRIIIDKSTETIIFETHQFLSSQQTQTITFNDVNNIEIAWENLPYSKGPNDLWQVVLNTYDEIHNITYSHDKYSMLTLANEISNYTGKPLIDNSEKKDSWFSRLYKRHSTLGDNPAQSSELNRGEESQEEELSLEERWKRGGLLPRKSPKENED